VSPDVDEVLRTYYFDVLRGCWAPQMRLVDDGYRDLPFVEGEIEAPVFTATASWTLDDLLAFLRSWSGTANYVERHGGDPIEHVRGALERAWGDASERRDVRWPLPMRVARVP